ncbi:MAG TPA: aminotransferase, partial [Acidimicrobium sp.]|nr:aminotransferase [Acidimicrobium sp.]
MSLSSTNFTSRAFIEGLDGSDPLASFRNEFLINDDDVCYLDGNSLGRLPLATIGVVNDYL